jgi:hypothetical protein
MNKDKHFGPLAQLSFLGPSPARVAGLPNMADFISEIDSGA